MRVFCRGESAAHDDLGVETVLGDVRSAGAVHAAMAGVQVVFHLAAWNGAPSAEASLDLLSRTNVGGTRNVLSAARAAGVDRFVHFSSVKVLGETTDHQNISTSPRLRTLGLGSKWDGSSWMSRPFRHCVCAA